MSALEKIFTKLAESITVEMEKTTKIPFQDFEKNILDYFFDTTTNKREGKEIQRKITIAFTYNGEYTTINLEKQFNQPIDVFVDYEKIGSAHTKENILNIINQHLEQNFL